MLCYTSCVLYCFVGWWPMKIDMPLQEIENRKKSRDRWKYGIERGGEITILAGKVMDTLSTAGATYLKNGPKPKTTKQKTQRSWRAALLSSTDGSISQHIHPRHQRSTAWRIALLSFVDMVSVAWQDMPGKLGSDAIYLTVHVMCSSTSHAP